MSSNLIQKGNEFSHTGIFFECPYWSLQPSSNSRLYFWVLMTFLFIPHPLNFLKFMLCLHFAAFIFFNYESKGNLCINCLMFIFVLLFFIVFIVMFQQLYFIVFGILILYYSDYLSRPVMHFFNNLPLNCVFN